MTKYMKPFDWLLAGFVLFVWGLMCFWLWWPYSPLEIHSIEILNANKTVQQGGTLAYHIKWTKHTDRQGVVRRYFVNGRKHHLDDADGEIASAPIGPGEADIFMVVPHDIPTGFGVMQFTAAYPMNPIRTVVAPKTPAYSDRFTVTERNTKGKKGDTGKQGSRGEPGKNFWNK